MAFSSITVDRDPHIAWITLNRPDRLNAISDTMLQELDACLDELRDSDNRVIVIRGAGRAFSAGYDVAPDEAEIGYASERTPTDDYNRLVGNIDFFTKIWRHPQTVIAAVHGYCVAGATQLASFADITIVQDDAVIQASPSIPIGGGYISPLWVHLVGPKRAKLMSFDAGHRIDGRTAADWGWATEAVPADRFEARVRELAESIARTPAALLNMKKEAINRAIELQGFLTMARMGAETDALLHLTPEVQLAQQRIAEKGLKGAIADFNDGALF